MVPALLASPWSTWGIAAAATVGVITRPFGWPEFVWAVAGAALLVLLGLLSPADAWAGVAKGTDVYLFLGGMMLLSELARQEGLFDWLAAHAARRARGSEARLFGLVFAVGTVVTVFLSNDATAVVLTPPSPRWSRRPKPKSRCPTCSSAPSSPTPRASCCRSRTRPTWSSTAATCRRFCRGCRATPCRRCSRSAAGDAGDLDVGVTWSGDPTHENVAWAAEDRP